MDSDESKEQATVKANTRDADVAGGRTEEQLESFYRQVHRKLAAHYPGIWLLDKGKKAKPKDEELSEAEEQQELEKEEEEMDQVEKLVKLEKEEQVAKDAPEEAEEEPASPPRRRNPDRAKRAKLEIKLEDEQDAAKASGLDPAKLASALAKDTKTNVCGGQKTVLASLISTVLSQNTTDRNSSAAWANLQRAYKDNWERVRTAKPSELVDVIRTGGLAQRKGGIIQGLLNQLYKERDGELSLEHLREMSTEEAKQELTKYKGIGPKTASCVLMFNMKRADFPVDTHVHRVSTRLGFVRGTTREQTYAFMNATMPDEIKRDMHVLLIRHGKQICKARQPKCGECFLRDDCRYGQTLKKEAELLKESAQLAAADDDEDEAGEEEEEEEEEGETVVPLRTRKSTRAKRRKSAPTSSSGRAHTQRRAAKRRRSEGAHSSKEEDIAVDIEDALG